MVKLFYTIYISVDLAHHAIYRAKVDKCGMKSSLSGNRPSRNDLKC